MTREETVKWLESLKHDIGKAQHSDLWHYEQAIDVAIEALKEQEWRSCSDDPPETGADILISSDCGEIVGYYEKRTDTWWGVRPFVDSIELDAYEWRPL